MGNASELISQERRSKILEAVDSSWSKYGADHFPKARNTLFGDEFKATLTEKVEKDAALSKAVAIIRKGKRITESGPLPISFRSFQNGGVKFSIPSLTKTRREGPLIEAFYPEFPTDPRLCPVQTLVCYEQRSKELRRGKSSWDPLFIATRKPHKPVKACTNGHWLKAVMTKAGTDTKCFSAHSTRGAATSKAKASGALSAEILKAANWASNSTFAHFYHRPVVTSEFGHHVLTPRPSRTAGEL